RKVREVGTRNSQFFTIGIVGYTNAGKSTLMNRLTDADVLVEDKLFATLDTRTRLWEIDSGFKAMISDTVGFIEKLPHHLIASFKATLEEAAQADILLHVVDVSDIDLDHHIQVVEQVLEDLNLQNKPILLVFNKIDLQTDVIELARIKERYPNHVLISAQQGWHISELKEQLIQIWEKDVVEMDFILTPKDGRWISWFEENTRVLSKVWQEENLHYNVQLSQEKANWISVRLSYPPKEKNES
ncbi:MAG TPA: 50S ribosome-binding GTPase, partial [Planctomycetota bacterium]|nr:50S ribosome-binding GTPase [Planctomycetota bacterium]